MYGKLQRKQDGLVKNDQTWVRVGNTLVINMVWLIAIYSNGWTESSNKIVCSQNASAPKLVGFMVSYIK